MEMPNGNLKWKCQMEMPNGNAKWKSQMEMPNGNAEWKSLMEISNGTSDKESSEAATTAHVVLIKGDGQTAGRAGQDGKRPRNRVRDSANSASRL